MGLFRRRKRTRAIPADLIYDDGPGVIGRLRAVGYPEEDLAPLGDLSQPFAGSLQFEEDDFLLLATFIVADGLHLPAIDTRDGSLMLSSIIGGRMDGSFGGERLTFGLRLGEPLEGALVDALKAEGWNVESR
jgi:hypothetical protein